MAAPTGGQSLNGPRHTSVAAARRSPTGRAGDVSQPCGDIVAGGVRGLSPVRLAGGAACLLPGQGRDDPACPRCTATMIWTKASWHCPSCRYKEGCCG